MHVSYEEDHVHLCQVYLSCTIWDIHTWDIIYIWDLPRERALGVLLCHSPGDDYVTTNQTLTKSLTDSPTTPVATAHDLRGRARLPPRIYTPVRGRPSGKGAQVRARAYGAAAPWQRVGRATANSYPKPNPKP